MPGPRRPARRSTRPVDHGPRAVPSTGRRPARARAIRPSPCEPAESPGAVMPGPLLETKIRRPRRRHTRVARPRLRQRLDEAREATLLLVSAPAGFGKSTLLSQWLADDDRAAWVSLD